MTAVAATDEKSIPALKFNIFMGHDRIDSILGSYWIPETEFFPIGRPKISEPVFEKKTFVGAQESIPSLVESIPRNRCLGWNF